MNKSIKYLWLAASLGFLTACSNDRQNDENETVQEERSKEQVEELFADKQPDTQVERQADKQLDNELSEQPEKQLKSLVTGEGKIVFNSFEGGFYGIITRDGRRLLPMNLGDGFKKDGLPVEFSAIVETDIMTIQQWGQPVTLKHIKAVGEPRGGNKADH